MIDLEAAVRATLNAEAVRLAPKPAGAPDMSLLDVHDRRRWIAPVSVAVLVVVVALAGAVLGVVKPWQTSQHAVSTSTARCTHALATTQVQHPGIGAMGTNLQVERVDATTVRICLVEGNRPFSMTTSDSASLAAAGVAFTYPNPSPDATKYPWDQPSVWVVGYLSPAVTRVTITGKNVDATLTRANDTILTMSSLTVFAHGVGPFNGDTVVVSAYGNDGSLIAESSVHFTQVN